MSTSIKQVALRTIELEAQSIAGLASFINDDFEKAVQAIAAGKGRVVVSGIGKSAVIAQKIVATFNSTGTPSIFMHAADAIHGDLGMVQKEDVVIIISKSGESPEIKVLLPLIIPGAIGCQSAGISSRQSNTRWVTCWPSVITTNLS